MSEQITFSQLNVDDELQENLRKLGINEPAAVQARVIPEIAAGKNVMFQSETGTGKTFAYLLPLLQMIMNNPSGSDVELLIASPTYELASQIKLQVQLLCDLKCTLCIGGAPIARQIEALKEKPKIVIGGPQRLLELIHLKKLKAHAVKCLVLDEADRLLSPELRDSTEGLLERLPGSVQLIGCSATVSDYTRRILLKARNGFLEGNKDSDRNNVTSPAPIELISLPPEDVLRKKITHWAIYAERRDKIDTLRSFINAVQPEKLIVFTARTDQVDNIVSKLQYRKIDCAPLSAKSDKKIRKASIDRFKSGKLKVLVTTDLASRGLDIPGVTHVVQMDLPESTDFFIHRSGRTARAGQTGFNCVIGDEFEMEKFAALEKKLKIIVYPKMLYMGKLISPDEVDEAAAENPHYEKEIMNRSHNSQNGKKSTDRKATDRKADDRKSTDRKAADRKSTEIKSEKKSFRQKNAEGRKKASSVKNGTTEGKWNSAENFPSQIRSPDKKQRKGR